MYERIRSWLEYRLEHIEALIGALGYAAFAAVIAWGLIQLF